MIPIRRLGEIIVWGLGVVPVLLWFAVGLEAPVGRRGAEVWPVLPVGQVAGLAGMALLSVSFVLSARLRGLEDYFGALDGMYRTQTCSCAARDGSPRVSTGNFDVAACRTAAFTSRTSSFGEGYTAIGASSAGWCS